MAKFVLAWFKDDAEADWFADNNAPGETTIRVVGIYKDPTHKPCSCAGDHSSVRQNRFHSRYGWYVHGVCGRVSSLWRPNYGKRLFQVFGMNMLPRNQTPKSLQNPETFDYKEE